MSDTAGCRQHRKRSRNSISMVTTFPKHEDDCVRSNSGSDCYEHSNKRENSESIMKGDGGYHDQ